MLPNGRNFDPGCSCPPLGYFAFFSRTNGPIHLPRRLLNSPGPYLSPHMHFTQFRSADTLLLAPVPNPFPTTTSTASHRLLMLIPTSPFDSEVSKTVGEHHYQPIEHFFECWRSPPSLFPPSFPKGGKEGEKGGLGGATVKNKKKGVALSLFFNY